MIPAIYISLTKTKGDLTSNIYHSSNFSPVPCNDASFSFDGQFRTQLGSCVAIAAVLWVNGPTGDARVCCYDTTYLLPSGNTLSFGLPYAKYNALVLRIRPWGPGYEVSAAIRQDRT